MLYSGTNLPRLLMSHYHLAQAHIGLLRCYGWDAPVCAISTATTRMGRSYAVAMKADAKLLNGDWLSAQA
jgi:hypothetical protein